MIRRSLVVLCLAALPVGPSSAQVEGAAPDEEAAAARIASEIRRLQEAVAGLAPEVDAGDPDAGTSARVDEVTLRLLALRQEIDQILILLEAQPPAVRQQVGRLLAEAGEVRVAPPVPAEPAPDAAVEERAGVAESESGAETPVAGSSRPEPSAEPPRLGEPCAELAVFDSNDDGVLSGLDRYWRYFRLWRDDGDGAMEAKELRGLYDSGVAELTVRLGTYRTVDGDSGDVLDDGVLRLDLPGREGVALLTLDADRLARGGELELRGADGAALTGRLVLTPDMVVAAADGRTTPLACAR